MRLSRFALVLVFAGCHAAPEPPPGVKPHPTRAAMHLGAIAPQVIALPGVTSYYDVTDAAQIAALTHLRDVMDKRPHWTPCGSSAYEAPDGAPTPQPGCKYPPGPGNVYELDYVTTTNTWTTLKAHPCQAGRYRMRLDQYVVDAANDEIERIQAAEAADAAPPVDKALLAALQALPAPAPLDSTWQCLDAGGE